MTNDMKLALDHLEYAINEADAWYDEYRGAGKMTAPKMQAARKFLAEQRITVDLHAHAWEEICTAANSSTWMPKEYMMNDWVADVCRWLREGPTA